jgi:hypothetical protein
MRRWKDNTKMDLREMVCEVVSGPEMVHCADLCACLAYTLINFWAA